ncbi:unnamed protein product [Coffea canephora]|uniref:Uncharacterized protein n=1 Tax=Coffea canephora TaxID=49390 RepID=A0A068UY86_COFCA|nr:unnamed protein product [Coffea canephora]
MHSLLGGALLIVFFLVDLAVFALGRGLSGLRRQLGFDQLCSATCLKCLISVVTRTFSLGGRYTQIPRSQICFYPLDLMWMCFFHLARGLVSMPHMFLVEKSLSGSSPPLKFFQMNASLRSSGVCMGVQRKVPVLVYLNAGLHF